MYLYFIKQSQIQNIMTTLEIGQKGKLGNEVLTVVSFDNTTLKYE